MIFPPVKYKNKVSNLLYVSKIIDCISVCVWCPGKEKKNGNMIYVPGGAKFEKRGFSSLMHAEKRNVETDLHIFMARVCDKRG